MDFEFSPKVQELRERLMTFMDDHVHPNEALFLQQVDEGDRWERPEILEDLKKRANKRVCGTCFCRKNTADSVPDCHDWSTRPWQRSWAALSGHRKHSTAVRRIRATWKCWRATATRPAGAMVVTAVAR